MATTIKAIAYHITWTTYGTWLWGDDRGWCKKGHSGTKPPKPGLQTESQKRLMESPVVLTTSQREIIEATIKAHCKIRKWELHAANARTNHVHVVVSSDRDPDEVMNQLKAWCSRKLSDADGLTKAVAVKAGRRRWFTEGGDKDLIHDEEHLRSAVRYVLEGQ